MAPSHPLRYHGTPPAIPVVESQSDVAAGAANYSHSHTTHPAVASVFPGMFTQTSSMESASSSVLQYRGSPPPPPPGCSLPPEFQHVDLKVGNEEQVALQYSGVPPPPPPMDARS